MTSKPYLLNEDDPRSGRFALLGLFAVVGVIAAALYRLGGPPHLPQVPSQGELLLTLEGSNVPLAAFAYVLTTATWVVLAYLVLSVLVNLAVVIGERAGARSGWIGVLKAASRRFTLPLVRRIVEAAFVTTIVLNTAGRTIPAMAASPPSVVSVVVPSVPGAAPQPATPTNASAVEYTVQRGDTLWAIAEHVYGDGAEFPKLVAANAGRQMPDGRHFTEAGVIDVGWKLTIPLPSPSIAAADGGLEYVVQPNDTLSGIAARLLGDPDRWHEVFQLNEGKARDPEGRVLTSPDLIWPGLRLTLIASRGQPQPPPPATPVQPPAAAVEPPSLPPTPEATASPPPVPTPTLPVATPVVAVADQSSVPPAAYGAAGVAAVAAAAAAFVAKRRRRVRRSLSEPPTAEDPQAPMSDGFAEAEPARAFAYRLQGGESEPAVRLARHIEELLGSSGLDGAEIVTVAAGHSKAELTLSARASLREQLLAFGPEVQDSLDCSAGLSVTLDHDILLGLSRLKPGSIVSQLAPDRSLASSWLVPFGVRSGQQDTLWADWRQLGNLLIAGLPGGGAQTILNSLLASLIARCRPDDLQLVTVSSERAVASPLLELPHQRRVVDMSDPEGLAQALEDVQLELNRRIDSTAAAAGDEPHFPPRLVLVVGELANLGDAWAKLDDIAAQGPAQGIHVLAATLRTDELTEDVIAAFGSHLVMQTMDDDESIRLLGQPDAADLSGGGDYLLRIEGRRTVRARGFRIQDEHLQELADAVAEAFGAGLYPPETGESLEPEIPAQGDALADETVWRAPAETIAGFEEEQGSEEVSAIDSGLPGSLADEAALSVPPGNGAGAAAPDLVSLNVQADPDGRRVYEDVRLGFGSDDLDTLADEDATSEPDDAALWSIAREEAETAMAEGDAPRPRADGSDRPDIVLDVRCLGPYEVVWDGRQLSSWGKGGPNYMPWELLAFLAVQPHGRAPCDKVCEVLWPGVNPKLSRKRLHTTMWRLRTVLGEQIPGLASDLVRLDASDTCQLSTTLVQSDVWRFDELHQAAQKDRAETTRSYAELVPLYRGELLSDCGYDWIHSRFETGLTLRERYHEDYLDAARELAGIYRRDGDIAGAAALYKRVLALEPTVEDVVRELYECYALLGDKAALIREHRHLTEALNEELRDPDDPDDEPEQYEPEPETTEVYERALARMTHRTGSQVPSGR
ncbi:MAG: LysM peptidoglycan-binding domain-containing protein [Chloroflexota bacterium]|nr:LysM peptidoglycan-binding domain-containing protein [Chloroflexota bacterium]